MSRFTTHWVHDPLWAYGNFYGRMSRSHDRTNAFPSCSITIEHISNMILPHACRNSTTRHPNSGHLVRGARRSRWEGIAQIRPAHVSRAALSRTDGALVCARAQGTRICPACTQASTNTRGMANRQCNRKHCKKHANRANIAQSTNATRKFVSVRMMILHAQVWSWGSPVPRKRPNAPKQRAYPWVSHRDALRKPVKHSWPKSRALRRRPAKQNATC